jgi:hypothetical protein
MQNNIRAVLAAMAAALGLAALAQASFANGALDPGSPQLQATKAMNAKFASLVVAKRAGYGLLKDKNGIACIADDSMPGMTMGAMGVHYANTTLVGDGQLDYRTPEALVYAPAAKGKLHLAAVEYVVIKAAWDAKHSTAPVLFGHRFNETPAGNRFGLPAYYSLHAWLYKSNPAGEFAMWNPNVHCGAQS